VPLERRSAGTAPGGGGEAEDRMSPRPSATVSAWPCAPDSSRRGGKLHRAAAAGPATLLLEHGRLRGDVHVAGRVHVADLLRPASLPDVGLRTGSRSPDCEVGALPLLSYLKPHDGPAQNAGVLRVPRCSYGLDRRGLIRLRGTAAESSAAKGRVHQDSLGNGANRPEREPHLMTPGAHFPHEFFGGLGAHPRYERIDRPLDASASRWRRAQLTITPRRPRRPRARVGAFTCGAENRPTMRWYGALSGHPKRLRSSVSTEGDGVRVS
jgi:hypothetical protein